MELDGRANSIKKNKKVTYYKRKREDFEKEVEQWITEDISSSWKG